jgi:hypothetical protein
MPKTKSTPAQPKPAEPAASPKAPTKIDIVLRLLGRPEGASIPELMEATGWQAHSVRGALAGTIRKKLGRPVASDKTAGERRYRIAPEASA